MDLIGKILKDRYCIIGQADAGGSGTLYMARDLELSTIWAVKKIPPSKKKEGRMLRRLSHPCIPRMIDYAEEEDALFLIMEYIQGTPMSQLTGNRRLTYPQLLQYTENIVDTLRYLHTLDPPLVYADLKPANLICTDQKHLFLVDFGSAAFPAPDAGGRCVEGTPGYAAPEQYEGRLLAASDFYALGKTLRSLSTPLMRILHPAFSFFIRKCTRKSPSERFSDDLQLQTVLRSVRRADRLLPVFLSFCLMICCGFFLTTFPGSRPAAEHPTSVSPSVSPSGPVRFTNGALMQEFAQETPEAFLEKLTRHTRFYVEQGARLLSSSEDHLQIPAGSLPAEVLAEQEKELLQLLEECRTRQQSFRVYILLAATARLSGNPSQGLQYYRQFYLRYPEAPEIYPLYGRLLIECGQTQESLRLWEEGASRFGWESSGLNESEEATDREWILWRKELSGLQ